MKKSELLARIEALEHRIRVLEARPIYYQPPSVAPFVAPMPGTIWPDPNPPPWAPIVTCGSGSVTAPQAISF